MRIFYLLVGPESQPGVRERVGRYRGKFEAEGVETESHIAGEVVPGPGGALRHLLRLAREGWKADVVYNYRVPLSAKERGILKGVGAAQVFDFDDAIFVAPPFGAGRAPRVADLEATVRECRVVIAGNSFLADWARPLCPRVEVIPTCLDLSLYPAKVRSAGKGVVIGWVGLGHNLFYLETLRPAIEEVLRRHPEARLRVVSDADFPGASSERWSLEREADQIGSFDIGIMPLTDDPWSRGKCSYKALQYMALGIPPVVSPVGMNAEAVTHGVDGLHARDHGAWVEALSRLIGDPALRARLGAAARRTVEERYSSEIAWTKLRGLLREGGP